METKESQPNEQESLKIISEMIVQAKKSIRDDGFYYLLWGWLVIIASLVDYCLMKMEYTLHEMIWPIMMTLGGIISGVYGYKQDKKKNVKTHIDVLMAYLWGAFTISLFIFLYFTLSTHSSPYPPLLVLCGIGTFVSGGALKFRPLIIGGILFWIFAIVTFMMDYQYHLPFYALSMFVGYLIPGYILRAKYKNENV